MPERQFHRQSPYYLDGDEQAHRTVVRGDNV